MKILKKGKVIPFNCNSCDCEFVAGIHTVEENDGNYYAKCPMCGSECYTNVVNITVKQKEDK